MQLLNETLSLNGTRVQQHLNEKKTNLNWQGCHFLWAVTGWLGLADIKKMILIVRDVCVLDPQLPLLRCETGEGSVGKADASSQEFPTASHGASHGMCSAAGADVGEGG